jgi:hypothetical protein
VREVFDDGFVGHATDAGEGGDGAVDGFGGEVAEGEGFVVGEAGGAELLVGAVEEVMGIGVIADTADGMEAFEQAAVDGGGGFAVELLVDDGFDERFKGRLCACDSHGEGTSAFDEPAELWIGGRKIQTGFRRIIAGRSQRLERARHILTVSQERRNVLRAGENSD